MRRSFASVVAAGLAFNLCLSPLSAQKGTRPAKTSRPAPVAAVVPEVAPEKPKRTALEGQPRIDGSTTAILLGQMLSARSLGLNGQLRRLPVERRWQGAASSAAIVFPLDAQPSQIEKFQTWWQREPQYSGTNGAYLSLINNEADLILVAREPSSDELKAAQAKSVQLDARPIALDAFVFLVNSKNPVSSLTLAQIRGIYTQVGSDEAKPKINNWQQVGGENQSIFAFTRNRNSGSEELMEKLVMQGRKIITGRDRMVMSMMGPLEGVSRNPDSIAYSVYYYEHVMSPYAANKLLAIDGVQPTAENIASHRYPLAAEFYVVTRQGIDQNSPAARLRDWLLTEDGQKLIAESGYVPIGTKPAVVSTQ